MFKKSSNLVMKFDSMGVRKAMEITHSKTKPNALAIEGTCNFRDLGGYRTEDGMHFRDHICFRSDNLHRVAAAGIEQIKSLGVTKVIDLRRIDETNREPNVFSVHSIDQIEYVHIPLKFVPMPETTAPFTLGDLYRAIAEANQYEIGNIIRHIISNSTGATIFHCKAGKDRTGIIAALVLGIANVIKQDIIDDYQITSSFISPIMADLRAERPEAISVDHYDQLLTTDPAYMEQFLQLLEDKYGGVKLYLKTCGITEEEFIRFESRVKK